MNIDRLDKNRFIISVAAADHIDINIVENAAAFQELIILAAVKVGFSIKGRRLSVSKIMGIGYIYYVVSVFSQRLLPVAKIRHFAVVPSNAADLVSCAYRLALYIDLISYSSLICIDNSNMLVIGVYRHDSVMLPSILSEYGKTIPLTQKTSASLAERSDRGILRNAIEKIALIE